MTRFRILHLAEERVEAYRTRPPRASPTVLRRSHYEEGPEVKATNPYEVWEEFHATDTDGEPDDCRRLGIGDVLKTDDLLLVCNYWGFDPAKWQEPGESK